MNVYCITFPNGKRYVGVESYTSDRLRQHIKSESPRYKSKQLVTYAIRKHGWANCRIEYLAFARSHEECWALEQKYIADWNLMDKQFGYNQSKGGEKGALGAVRSEETRKRYSAAFKGRKYGPEYGIACSVRAKERLEDPTNHPMWGRHQSEGCKEKISQKAKERLKDPAHHPMWGKRQSEESKRKSSIAHKGRTPPNKGKSTRRVFEQCSYYLCHNLTYKYTSAIKKYSNTYCSGQCYNDDIRGKNNPAKSRSSDKNPNWRGGPQKIACTGCGVDILKLRCLVKQSNFHSQDCYRKYRFDNSKKKISLSKPRQPRYTVKRFTVLCDYCHSDIVRTLVNINKTNFCNVGCMGRYKETSLRGANNPSSKIYKQNKILKGVISNGP